MVQCNVMRCYAIRRCTRVSRLLSIWRRGRARLDSDNDARPAWVKAARRIGGAGAGCGCALGVLRVRLPLIRGSKMEGRGEARPRYSLAQIICPRRARIR